MSNTTFSFPFQPRDGYQSVGAPKKTTSNNIPKLFTPLTIRSVTFKNRIAVAPMCQYTSTDGFMNDYHIAHLGGFAKGGSGLIITEATAVEDIGRISPQDVGLWKDEHISEMKRVVDFLHAFGAKVGVQLAHAGRKASTPSPYSGRKEFYKTEEGGWEVVGPTDQKWGDNYPVPRALTVPEIKEIVKKFQDSARRALAAGFDLIEIHGAHGYLIHSFNSPLVNTRNDEYGGNFEGRTRLLREIVSAVRQVWPEDKPLFVRLSCEDWVEGGWDIEQTVQLAKILKDLGTDLVDCSSGGNSPLQRLTPFDGYQVPFADRVRKDVPGLLTGAVGKITDAKQAEEIISAGKADIVLLAREMLRNPNWPLKVAKELNVEVDGPVHYERWVGTGY